MPTVMSHSLAALAVGTAFAPQGMPARFWWLTATCAALPDLDVVSFAFGFRYSHVLGHRGITHSFSFALVLAFAIVALCFREQPFLTARWWFLLCFFFAVTASHPLLDALTNGGLGVAFFAPFDNRRYFFPWRPIEVSPIGVDSFLSARGAAVMLSEIKWIWAPSAVLVVLGLVRRKLG
jgi:inner membrane protein